MERFDSSDMEKRLRLYHGDNTERMFRGWADIWLSPEFRDWTIPPETLGAILDHLSTAGSTARHTAADVAVQRLKAFPAGHGEGPRFLEAEPGQVFAEATGDIRRRARPLFRHRAAKTPPRGCKACRSIPPQCICLTVESKGT